MSDDKNMLSEMADLEILFATARQAPPVLPKALQDVILQDARQLQQDRNAPEQNSQFQPAGMKSALDRVWEQFIAAIGGWPSLGGVAAAGLAGLWVGFAPPSFLPDPVTSLSSSTVTSQLVADLDYDISLLLSDEVFE